MSVERCCCGRWSILFLLLWLGAAVAGADDTVARFSSGDLSGWQSRSFAGQTRYQLVPDNDRQVLQAMSDASASAFGKQVRIDLRKTPFVNWRWKIADRLSGLNERSKAGDDYSARLYLVVDGGLLKWRTRTVTYVWSSNHPAGSRWPNAWSPKNAQIVAVRGSADETGQWYTEKRNAYADFKRAFAREIRFIDAVAVMTDTDNSGKRATAWYGDIFFTAD